MRICLAAADGRTESRAAPTAVTRSTRLTSSWSLPVTMRETSRMSSMSWLCMRAFRSMVSTPRRSSGSRLCPRSTAAQPTIALRGVRSSWDSVARNSSLSRLAASASSRAARSRSSRWSRSASAFLRSVTSVTVRTAPRKVASRTMGSMATSSQRSRQAISLTSRR
jgi:hypothetical protein